MGGARPRRAPPRARATPASTPRTTAAATPEALPITSSAAAASSSTTQTSVTCSSRPRLSSVPRRSTIARMPAQPMATSVRPRRHGRPKVSDTITATSTPRAARRPSRIRRAERSLSSGSEGGPAIVDVRQVDSRVGAHEAVLGLADDEIAASADHPHRLRPRRWPCDPRVGGVDPCHRPFGLRHHLLGHHHDIAVLQTGFGGGDQAGQVVALAHLGDAVDREHLETGHDNSTSARAVASSGPRMIVGATTQRTPSASTASDVVGVDLVDHQRGHQRSVEARHPHHRGLMAQLTQEAVGRALERGAGDDRRDRHRVVAAGHHRGPHAGHGQHGIDRHDRVGGRDDHSSWRSRWPRAHRARVERCQPRRSALRSPVRRGGAARSTPGTRSRPHRPPSHASAPDHRSRGAAAGRSPTRPRSPGSPSTASPPPEPIRAVEVGGEVAVAQVEPRDRGGIAA